LHRPDVAQIDQFKDEICDALTSYSSRIEDYLKEMSDCDQTCNALREEIRRLSDFTTTMCSEARCAFTGEIVAETNEPFYVFPSGYVALERALKNEVMPYLNEKQKSKVESIEKEIGDLRGKVNPSGSVVDSYFEKSETEYRLEALQSELDGLIAAECPLTGSVMVESIDRCFGDSKEDELYVASEDLMMEA
jgi:archaellum component FlaC